MRLEIAEISNTPKLVDAYVQVHNKFWYIEDLYDYEEGSDEYNRVREIVDACGWWIKMEQEKGGIRCIAI